MFEDKFTKEEIDSLCPNPKRRGWAKCWWCYNRYKIYRYKGKAKIKPLKSD